MSGAPAARVLSVGGHDIGYPHGHLGHLTGGEENQLRLFKLYLEEQGLYRPAPQPSHDDQTLLRFLRARRWVIKDAYAQFKDTEAWRKANQVDVLFETIDVDAYEQTRRLYPQWTGRRDRRGIPVYVFQVRHLDSKTVSAYEKSVEEINVSKAQTDGSTPQRLLCLFALYENLTRFVHPLCTEMPDRDHARTPITLSTNIVDVSHVSLRTFWNLKAHMQAASALATAHYPETLDRIFVIGAPHFFSTVWGWLKRWFDPITVSKFFILSPSEVRPTLEAFIEPRNIPKQYGGELDFGFFDRPTLDPKIRERLTWENGYTDFPEGPAYWVPIDGGKRLACVAVGSKEGKKTRERVCTIPVAFPPEEEQAAEVESTAEPDQTRTAAGDGARQQETAAPVATTDASAEADMPGIQDLSIAEDDAAAGLSEKATHQAAEQEHKTTAVAA